MNDPLGDERGEVEPTSAMEAKRLEDAARTPRAGSVSPYTVPRIVLASTIGSMAESVTRPSKPPAPTIVTLPPRGSQSYAKRMVSVRPTTSKV